MKKIIKSSVVILLCLCMVACSSLKYKDEKDLSRRGIQYYFDDNMYDTVVSELADYIEFNAPSMESVFKDNLRVYGGEDSALVIWIANDEKQIKLKNIINSYSEKMIGNIQDVADIEDVGVELNVEMIAQDTVNEIDRMKYVGVIDAIGYDGVDTELKTVIYTFKAGGRPGYIMGIVTDRMQEKERFVEIESDAQIMANTIRLK